jgi:two-component system OmpR family response regulator
MRLLLVEDQAALSEAIATHLKSNGFVVDTAFDLRTAQRALDAEEFGAVLLDLSLPDGDGLTLLSRLRQRGKHLPVIIMTARDQIRDRVKGLEAGADDYLVKPFNLDEMIARLHAVTRRYTSDPNPILALGRYAIDRAGHRLLLDGAEIRLTSKEWALVEKLVSNPSAIFSRDQLMQSLYSFDDDVGSNTVEVYVNRIRAKLGKDSIETVRGLGYRFKGG